jgi:hypothetical protein
MPLSLSQLAANTAQVTFQAGETPDQTCTITYWPGRITEQFLATSQVFQNAQNMDILAGFADLNKSLEHVIQSWDVFEDDAQTVMFPIDAARFSELPIALRIQAYMNIAGEVRPESIAPQIVTTQNS